MTITGLGPGNFLYLSLGTSGYNVQTKVFQYGEMHSGERAQASGFGLQPAAESESRAVFEARSGPEPAAGSEQAHHRGRAGQASGQGQAVG